MATEQPFVFDVVTPRNPSQDRMLIRLGTNQWRISLWSLYFGMAVEIPKKAKTTKGVYFGFCDENGTQQPMDEATHLGWSFEEDVDG